MTPQGHPNAMTLALVITVMTSASAIAEPPLAQGSCASVKAACRQDAIERRRTCESLPDDVGPCWTNFEKEMNECSVKARECRKGIHPRASR